MPKSRKAAKFFVYKGPVNLRKEPLTPMLLFKVKVSHG